MRERNLKQAITYFVPLGTIGLYGLRVTLDWSAVERVAESDNAIDAGSRSRGRISYTLDFVSEPSTASHTPTHISDDHCAFTVTGHNNLSIWTTLSY